MELIDKRKPIEHLLELKSQLQKVKNYDGIAKIHTLLRYLIDVEPVDAVPVVRCRDCIKISPSVTEIKNAVWCRTFRAYMPCDGFCSYGERKDGDGNG